MIEGPAEKAQALLAAVEAAMTPAPERALHGWIGELSLISAKRADDTMLEDARLRAYTSRLMGYPADVAKAALLEKRWPFFPSWAELADECDRLVKQRLLMLVAARRAAAFKAEPPRPGAPTEEERAHRAAVAAEILGKFAQRVRVTPTHAEAEAAE